MKTRHVLIVDDNIDDIEAIHRVLSKCKTYDYRITSVKSGETGLAKVEEQQFDCILLDYYLPGVSGFELFSQLNYNAWKTPIIVLTGNSDEMMAARLIKSGAQDYINKFTLTDANLHLKIDSAIRRHENLIQQRDNPKCKVLIVDDNEDDIELCERMLAKTPSRYITETAKSREEGVRKLIENKPDCVLLDYSMPCSSGLDTLSEMVALSPFTPVILMTGQGDESVAVNAIKQGAENYLVKSNIKGKLLDKILSVAVQKKKLEQQLFNKELALESKQKELNETLSFLNLVLDTIPGYIFVKDAEFKIVKANQNFLNLYPEHMQDRIIGYTTIEEYPQEEANEFLAKDREAFENGRSETLETITFPNGGVRILNTIKTRFTDSQSKSFILGTASDVTERETLISKLEKSNSDLEQFAYVASHDLKSPLNAIQKLVGWIEEDYGELMPDGAIQHFDLIKRRSARLSQLLSDLLSYSKVNKSLGPSEPVNFEQLIHQIHSVNDNAEHFELVVAPIELNLPKTALNVIFMNLLSNTVKHHHKGQGVITISVEKQDNGYLFYYSDDGPGIPYEYADKVFNMFLTLKTRDAIEGSGMGLAMVKKVLNYYDGSIKLNYNDEHKKGACFEIFWPAHTPKLGGMQ